jgi:uncharacterized protein YkwD
MITKTLLAITLVFTFCIDSPLQLTAQQGGNGAYKEMATEILKYVNEHRKEIGLKQLRMNGMVTAAAEKHTRNMATKKVEFGHDGFNERMEQLSRQLKPAYSFAENVSEGAETAKEAVEQWLQSPEHKKNIEGKDYNLTGIGIQKSADGKLYFTEIFIYKSY